MDFFRKRLVKLEENGWVIDENKITFQESKK